MWLLLIFIQYARTCFNLQFCFVLRIFITKQWVILYTKCIQLREQGIFFNLAFHRCLWKSWQLAHRLATFKYYKLRHKAIHYSSVIMRAMTSQISSVSIVCTAVCSGTDQRKHQSFVSLEFARGIHRWSVNSPHKRLVTRKMFPLGDVIMENARHIGKWWTAVRI